MISPKKNLPQGMYGAKRRVGGRILLKLVLPTAVQLMPNSYYNSKSTLMFTLLQ
jgi:hypothetical protein